MLPLTVTKIQDEKELRLAREFLLKQPQFYPDFQEWIDGKCMPRIELGEYKAIVAISDGLVVGDAVYRFLGERKIELKNFRIDPAYRNRDLGHFLLEQVRAETKDADMALDVTVDNFAGVEFFVRNGFHITGKENLYQPNQAEFLMLRLGLRDNGIYSKIRN